MNGIEFTNHLAPNGFPGEICRRYKSRRKKNGKIRPPCPDGWHHHGPYLPAGLVGDEWYWKKPRKKPQKEDKAMSIEDISNVQCNASVNIAGEHFRCELAVGHEVLAHQNGAAKAIWRDHESEATE